MGRASAVSMQNGLHTQRLLTFNFTKAGLSNVIEEESFECRASSTENFRIIARVGRRQISKIQKLEKRSKNGGET